MYSQSAGVVSVNYARIIIIVASSVSTYGCLNITHNLGLHGHLPGILIAYVYIEAATFTPGNLVHGHLPGSGTCPGHYSMLVFICKSVPP